MVHEIVPKLASRGGVHAVWFGGVGLVRLSDVEMGASDIYESRLTCCNSDKGVEFEPNMRRRARTNVSLEARGSGG